MKKIILHLPTLTLCGFYRILSFVFSKFRKTRIKGNKYFDKYEDKLFTVFTPYVIRDSHFKPMPSKRYKQRHGLYVSSDESINLSNLSPEAKAKNEAIMQIIFSQCTEEQQKEFLNMKGFTL